jgi:hypothetical protein
MAEWSLLMLDVIGAGALGAGLIILMRAAVLDTGFSGRGSSTGVRCAST